MLASAHHWPQRGSAAALLLINAAIHVYLAPMHLAEAPYIGVLFILLAVACVALIAGLVIADHPWVWAAAGIVSALGLAAFIVSRTAGLPQIHDDIGNWSDPLGIATLAAEAGTIALALAAGLRAGKPAPRSGVVTGQARS